MQVVYRPSFLRRYQHLPPNRRRAVQRAVERLLDTIHTHRIPPGGLGIKRLQGDFWELRSDIRDRVIFLLRTDVIEVIFVGNHDDIRRFLRER